ncbi:hypothetical protein [Microcoleus sp. herbarium2]|uniref:hypothetical protein n=1 Tax=Microcoleus sp. herbarium2 TaxID=3055433 RepID=UPI002FD49C66
MLGGAGDDWLFGDQGNDTLIGGTGNDRFMFGIDLDSETILDFTRRSRFDRLNGWSEFLATEHCCRE